MNFALSDEQEFLKEAARGALGALRRPSRRRARRWTAASCRTCGRPPCEAGWPGLLIVRGARRRRARRARSDARVRRARARAGGVPLLGHLPATFLLDAAGDDSRGRTGRRRDARAAYVPAKPPSDIEASWTADPALGLRAPPGAGAGGRRGGDRRGRLGARRARAPTLLVGVAVGADGRAARCVDAAADGVAVEPVDRLRRDALARPRRASTARRPRELDVDGGRAGRGLVRRPGAAGRRVARRRRGRARGVRRVRQGALHVRPRDRLLPGGQARAGGGPAAARERPLAHVLRGLGGAGQAGRVRRSRRPRSGSRRARRSTTRRARRSPSTAASAPRGSTTRRCTSAARSSRGGCSAAHGRRGRPRGRRAAARRARGRAGRPRQFFDTVLTSGSSTVRGM